MKIELHFIGRNTKKPQMIVTDDMTSPTGGYTQRHADQVGQSYVGKNGRAQELFGNSDFWEFNKAIYQNNPKVW